MPLKLEHKPDIINDSKKLKLDGSPSLRGKKSTSVIPLNEYSNKMIPNDIFYAC